MRFVTAASIIVFSLLFSASLSVHAIYKCSNAKSGTTYSDMPCDHAEQTLEITPTRQADGQSAHDVRARENAELHRLQKLRESRERQEEQILHMQQRSLAAKRKKCQALALEKKWKEEDATNAALTLRQQMQARRKARKADEKYQSICN